MQIQLTIEQLPIYHANLCIPARCCRFIRDDAAEAEAVRQREAEAAAERQRIAASIRDSLAKQVCHPLHRLCHFTCQSISKCHLTHNYIRLFLRDSSKAISSVYHPPPDVSSFPECDFPCIVSFNFACDCPSVCSPHADCDCLIVRSLCYNAAARGS